MRHKRPKTGFEAMVFCSLSSDAEGGTAEDPHVCTSYRQRPATLEQGIAYRPEEASRAEARLVHSCSVEIARSKRDLAIFNLAIDSKLRACDLVKLRLDDICSGLKVRHRATIVQKKTGRPVQFEISEQSRNSVEAWLPMLRTTGSRYLFPSRLHASPHISTRQYARLVHRWVESIGLEPVCTARTRCGVRRPPRFIARPATCAQFSYSSAIRS